MGFAKAACTATPGLAAKMSDRTTISDQTVIEGLSIGTHLLELDMVFDFLGDRCRMVVSSRSVGLYFTRIARFSIMIL